MRVSPIAVAVAALACAPAVDGPTERARAADRADAARLAAQLDALPGVVRSEVLVRRPAPDPLTVPAPAPPPALSAVVIVDDRADRAAVAAAARTLARAVVAAEPAIVVEVGAVRPEVAALGPFTVGAASKGPLKLVLGGAFAAILVLAGWLAHAHRRARS